MSGQPSGASSGHSETWLPYNVTHPWARFKGGDARMIVQISWFAAAIGFVAKLFTTDIIAW
jgi:hypothetical protein